MLNKYLRISHLAAILIIIISCEENPINLEENDLPLDVDTVSFPVTKTSIYKVLPQMGNLDTLYFGEINEFKFHYNLISFDTLSEGSDHTYSLYRDSLIVDSVEISLKSFTDSVLYDQKFNLRYFPDYSDSVFYESVTNYKNFEYYLNSEILSSSFMKIDSSDTTIMLKFSIGSEIVNKITGSNIDNFNMSFLIETSDQNKQPLRFHSSETISGYYPKLKVYYKNTIDDTINFQKNYPSFDDLTIIEPPTLSLKDTSNLTLGYAKGLKGLIFVDLDGWKLPERGIIKRADLILNKINSDTITAFVIDSYPLESEILFGPFSEYESDPYKVDYSALASGSVSSREIKFNHRKTLRSIGNQSKLNYGFKIEASAINNPFYDVSFYNLIDADYFPMMRIIYAYP